MDNVKVLNGKQSTNDTFDQHYFELKSLNRSCKLSDQENKLMADLNISRIRNNKLEDKLYTRKC